MLAMLAMTRDGERTRGWLQDRLWGGRQEAQARGSLRRELSDLRKRVNVGPEPLLITLHDRVRLDLSRMEVDARGAADSAEAPAVSQEFLEGLDIPGAEGFEDWLREQRSVLASPLPVRASSEPGAAKRGAALLQSFNRRPVVAVLAFQAARGAAVEPQFCEGLAEDLLTGLARSRMIAVRSQLSSMTYDASRAHTPKICAELQADYIVQGHVRGAADQIRVLVTLSGGAEDKMIWSARYQADSCDLFAAQDRMVASIIGALEPALLDHEETRSLRDTEDSRHWSLVMRGRWRFWRAKAGDFAVARELLTEALALEPEDVPTLTLLALCHLGEIWSGVAKDPAQSIASAHEMSAKAVALDAADAYAHSVLGTVLFTMGLPDRATAEQRHALQLNPFLAAAAGELGRMHLFAGDLVAALEWSDRSISMSPNDPHAFLWHRNKAFACLIAGRYEEACGHAADACAHSPHQFFLHYLLAACRSAAGDLAHARAALAEGRRLLPRYTSEMLRLGAPFAVAAHGEIYEQALRKAGWEG